MLSYVWSGGIYGIGCIPVRVETDISSGMPMFELVGHLTSEVREASSRVRTALKNSGYNIPVARITVNLSPGDLRKSGTGYDLAIALSILECMEVIPKGCLDGSFVAGELMLSGEISKTRGILPMILEAAKRGYKRCIIPSANEDEGSVAEGIEVIGVSSLEELISFLKGENIIKPYKSRLDSLLSQEYKYEHNFAEVKGQAAARRGVEIAAAGLHNLMMSGPPGAGKTMIARCIPSVLPPLSKEECFEISSIYSVRGVEKESLITRRPFIAAHHTSTDISLVGGGALIRPGAVSMAHKGVLFLDELPEFSRKALEALRQPLEDGEVSITRSREMCTYPADFMMVAAMNPCPCGYYPDRRKCSCTDAQRDKYMSKISGPLMDRIDLCVLAQKVTPYELETEEKSESSADIRRRVIKAHEIQKVRFEGRNINFNSQMNNKDISIYCKLLPEDNDYLTQMAKQFDMSARTYYRILKVARTIADLAGSESVKMEHLAEAMGFKVSW